MLPVLTVTLNPALDVTTSVDRLLPQQKLRCAAPRLDPGGGGVNVSRAIKELGGESLAFVAVGGNTGAQFRSLLSRSGIEIEYWPLIEETRSSFTVQNRYSEEWGSRAGFERRQCRSIWCWTSLHIETLLSEERPIGVRAPRDAA